MTKVAQNNMRISGISCVVPTTELSLLDNPNLYNGNQKKINRVISSSGFLKRRVADKETTTADLCEFAAKDLIKKLKIDKSTIDGLLFISYTPDYLMPATAYVLHGKLGLNEDCICMDIPQACSGFLFGLYQSAIMLNSGCKKVLLLVGDTFSKFSDMFNDNSAPVFGDAGTAILLEYDELAKPIYFNIKSDGHLYNTLICQNGGFRNVPQKDSFHSDGTFQYDSKMMGAEIFNFTIEKIAPTIEEILNFSKYKKDEIDYFLMHQANKFILKNIAEQLDVDFAKMPCSTLTKYGNQCGASIPCLISDVLKNDINGKKVVLSGFGVGLSWISAVTEIDNIYCSNIIEYKG